MNLQAPLPYVFFPKARSSRVNPNAAPEARINNNTFHLTLIPQSTGAVVQSGPVYHTSM